MQLAMKTRNKDHLVALPTPGMQAVLEKKILKGTLSRASLQKFKISKQWKPTNTDPVFLKITMSIY